MAFSTKDLKRNLYKRDKSPTDQDVNLHSYILKKAINKFKNNTQQALPKNLKLSDICKEIGVGMTSGMEDVPITRIFTNHLTTEAGGALILLEQNPEKYERNIDESLRKGAEIIFADKVLFEKSGVNAVGKPLILVEDGINHFRAFYRKYRNNYKGKMICITGSVGKTTTKGYIEAVLDGNFDAFISPASKNAGYQITDNILYKWDNSFDVCVQEVGAMEIGTIEGTSEILTPDISVITNILPHHMAAYKSYENIFKDKTSLVRNMNEGGVAVVNYDDKNIREYDFGRSIVTFGMNTEADVDYRAVNVVQNGETLSMDIRYNGGGTHVESGILGDFNAYNILAAFAVGKLLGMDDAKIVEGISKYGSSGIRQNVMEYGDNKFIVDCFNVCNETIINAVKILEDFEVKEGGRKIAVVGGENTLGEFRTEKTRELGQAIARYDIDEFICFGTSETTEAALDLYGDAVTLYDTLKECGVANCRLITSFTELVEHLAEDITPNDVVLFKSIIYLNLPVALDKAFGIGMSLQYDYTLRRAKTKTIKGYTATIYSFLDEAYITNASKKIIGSTDVKIPDSFGGKPVFGISKGLFAYSAVKSVDFGKTLKLIGTGAFKECKGLEKINIPDSVLHIMEGAFKNCRRLTEVKIGAGIRQIDNNAFAGCSGLKTIMLPEKAGLKIEENAIPEHVNIKYY